MAIKSKINYNNSNILGTNIFNQEEISAPLNDLPVQSTINYLEHTNITPRDYYKGTSFRYSKEWLSGTHYLNDQYIIDFVVYNNVLLRCKKSHLSSLASKPINFIYDSSGNISGINSEYWDFVLTGISGSSPGIRITNNYWEICNDTSVPVNQQVWVNTGIKAKFEFSDLSASEVAALQQPAIDLVENFINTTIVQNTGQNENKVISQKVVTNLINQINNDLTNKADKVHSAVAGHIATLDSSGNLVDSGKGISDINPLWGNIQGSIENQADLMGALNAKYEKPSTGIPASDLASGVIPDVSNFITKSVDDLVNYYLKSETYTKAEVQALIGAIQQFHYETYASTSAVTNPQGNVLYLIGPTGSGEDKYEEYVYDVTKQNPWVKIGDTSIDLSNYVTTSDLNTALSAYTTSAELEIILEDYVTSDDLENLLEEKQSFGSGTAFPDDPKEGDVFVLTAAYVHDIDSSELKEEDFVIEPYPFSYYTNGIAGKLKVQINAQQENNPSDCWIFWGDSNYNFRDYDLHTFDIPATVYRVGFYESSNDGMIATSVLSFEYPAGVYEYDGNGWTLLVSGTDRAAWNGKYSKPSSGIPASDLAAGVIPDVSNFITKSVNDLVNYYTKSETYTKGEVNGLIGAINQFHYEIYPSTNAVQDPQSNVLYLIGPTGSGSDRYEEYVFTIDWVKIGDTSIDLSGYVTTSDLNTALSAYTTTANLTTLLAGKANDNEVVHLAGAETITGTKTFRVNTGTDIEIGNSIYATGVGHNDWSWIKHKIKNSPVTLQNSLDEKADKVTSATSGNFAALDSNGNLMDSGHKHSDYITSHQDISGKADKVSGATSGNFAGLDGNGNLTDSGKKASDFQPTIDSSHKLAASLVSGLATVATSGSYNDLSNIPPAVTVDQIYDGTSSNPQSGIAIEGELENFVEIDDYSDTFPIIVNPSNYYTKTETEAIVETPIESTQPSNGFLPNVIYDLGEITNNVAFTIAVPTNNNIANTYVWTFDTGSTAPTITWPSNIIWFGGSAPAINTGKHYEITVRKGYANCLEF